MTLGECKIALVARYNRVTLQWVAGHQNNPGNENTDLLAKEGSHYKVVRAEPTYGIPYQCIVAAAR